VALRDHTAYQEMSLGQRQANHRASEAMLRIVDVLTTAGEHYQRGHYKNPMSDQEIEEKFSALTHGLLTPAQTDAILDCLWHLA
jgi:2-methylcitrate dehydratase PrpD